MALFFFFLVKINNIASKQAYTAEVHQNYTEKEQGEKSSFETKTNNKKYKNNKFAILKHILYVTAVLLTTNIHHIRVHGYIITYHHQ